MGNCHKGNNSDKITQQTAAVQRHPEPLEPSEHKLTARDAQLLARAHKLLLATSESRALSQQALEGVLQTPAALAHALQGLSCDQFVAAVTPWSDPRISKRRAHLFNLFAANGQLSASSARSLFSTSLAVAVTVARDFAAAETQLLRGAVSPLLHCTVSLHSVLRYWVCIGLSSATAAVIATLCHRRT